MSNTVVAEADDAAVVRGRRWGWPSEREVVLYAGAVVLGALLITITAINQPYNQNEWAQISPYGSNKLSVIVSGTRQPPLDPLLGAAVQHVLGEGQLRQRLVPVLCGVGSLIVMAGLLRRRKLGAAGVTAMYVMATAPVFLRYSAYIRPYALPVFLMLVCCWAGSRWLDGGGRRWLVTASAAALLLPTARVPEPLTFMGMSALVLVVAAWRGRLPRNRALMLAAAMATAILTVGAVTFRSLQSQTSGHVFDTNPAHAIERAGAGVHELLTYVLPLYAHWFPWWPLTVAFLVAALAMRQVRAALFGTWYWLPLLAAPLVFTLAYHFLNPYPLDIRHYRARFAYFYAPPLIVLVALVGHAVATSGVARRWGRWTGPAAVGLLLVSQLPVTWQVTSENDVADLGMAGDVLRAKVPQDGLVLYDSPAPAGFWRQPFAGRQRYLRDAPQLKMVSSLAKGKSGIQATGPVYLLILDSECATSVVCDMPRRTWMSHEVRGYEVVSRFDRFTLYGPTSGQQGRAGAVDALRALAEAYGPDLSSTDVFAEARLLKRSGQPEVAHKRIQEHCSQLDGYAATKCFKRAASYGLFHTSDVPAT